METLKPHQEEMLRLIMEGTATATGNEFFQSLVTSLATVLGVRYAWVCEFAEAKTRVRTLAFCANNACIDNFEYDLDVAPCKNVYDSGSLCHYRKGLQELFPRDKDLVTINGESYLGVPLVDDAGQILGHMAIIDVKEFPAATHEVWLFKIFAGRARAELERLRAEKEVQESKDRLAEILESAMDAILTFDTQKRITLFNDAAEKVFGTELECDDLSHSLIIEDYMFRIKKSFENDFTVIFNVEGEVKDERVDDWTKEISEIVKAHSGQVILNFCRVSYIGSKAMRVLSLVVHSGVYIMNSSGYMKNLLQAQGPPINFLD